MQIFDNVALFAEFVGVVGCLVTCLHGLSEGYLPESGDWVALPCMMTQSLFRMRTCCFVNRASKLLLQNWLMEIRALLWKFGNTWACWASIGKSGVSRSAVWVD